MGVSAVGVLDHGRNGGKVESLGADVEDGRQHGDVNVVLASHLGGGDDDLGGLGAVGSINGVLEDTDGTDELSDRADSLGSEEVGGVGNDLLGLDDGVLLGDGVGEADSGNLSGIVVEDLLEGSVQGVGTSVDGGQEGETLGKLSKTVEREDVGGVSETGHGLDVENDTLDGLTGRAVEVRVLGVESHGVSDELGGPGIESEDFVGLTHGVRVKVKT